MGTPPGGYELGIDLGTTYTAAAVARQGKVEVVGLGNRAAAIPSVVHLSADGTLLTGEAASRRAATEPTRVAREFKRRLGDPTPVLLGGTPYSAEALIAKLLRWVIGKVSELEGGAPSGLAITHPANWGPYKKDLFGQSLRLADVTATTLTEPEAAAIAYAANERVERDALVAVYDLGGGTFDAAVLRKTGDGFAILGRPEGIERLGGIDFDEAVVGHVRQALNGELTALDANDPATLAALSRLRRECVEAKEALSSDTNATIDVTLPGVQKDVRLTRAEFEQMIRPTLSQTVDALRRALESAAVEPGEITAVLLVGGSSRIPLVAELVSDAFGRPIAVDAHPKHAIALGAAHAAALAASDGAPRPTPGAAVHTAGTAHDQAGPSASDPPSAAVVPESGSVPVAAHVSGTSGFRPEQQLATQARSSLRPTGDGTSSVTDATTWLPSTSTPARRPARALWVTGVVVALALVGVAAGALARMNVDPAGAAAAGATAAAVGADTVAVDAAAVDAEAVEPDEPLADPGAGAEQQAEPDATDDGAGTAAEVPPDRDFVTIDDIGLDGDAYVVDFSTYRYEPELPGQHVHFFFDTVSEAQAGQPGKGPWFLYGGPSPFTGYTVADRPVDATQMCSLVANPDHSIVPESGTCRDLP